MTALATGQPATVRATVRHTMGMPVSVHVRGPRPDGGPVTAAVERVFDWLAQVDRLFSPFRPDSEVCRLQRGDLGLVDADPLVREVARLCDRASARTGGAFTALLPGPGARTGFNPTGLVKGWAVQRAVDDLAAAPGLAGHDVLVNAGGDIAVRCGSVAATPWRIGIEDPRDRSTLLATISLRRGGVATSGTAARGRHILDPATGKPVRTDLVSATVTGPDLAWADVYATAAFVRGRAGAAWLATLPGYRGLLVTTHGSLIRVGQA